MEEDQRAAAGSWYPGTAYVGQPAVLPGAYHPQQPPAAMDFYPQQLYGEHQFQHHGQFYAQQDQGLVPQGPNQQPQSSSQQQPTKTFDKEENLAAKARAWASAKEAAQLKQKPPSENADTAAPLQPAPGGQQQAMQVPPPYVDGLHGASLPAVPVVWPTVPPIHIPPPAGVGAGAPHYFQAALPSHVLPRPQVPPLLPVLRPMPPFTFGGNMHVGNPERPKKTVVPFWLKDELKKKAAVSMVSQNLPRENGKSHSEVLISSDDMPNPASVPDSPPEAGTGDAEDVIESEKTVAVTRAIKRIVTDVLLKVTDNLFNEIAREVIDEEEESREKAVAAPVTAAAPVLDEAENRGAGNLLGLASYASDDDSQGNHPQANGKAAGAKNEPQDKKADHNCRIIETLDHKPVNHTALSVSSPRPEEMERGTELQQVVEGQQASHNLHREDSKDANPGSKEGEGEPVREPKEVIKEAVANGKLRSKDSNTEHRTKHRHRSRSKTRSSRERKKHRHHHRRHHHHHRSSRSPSNLSSSSPSRRHRRRHRSRSRHRRREHSRSPSRSRSPRPSKMHKHSR